MTPFVDTTEYKAKKCGLLGAGKYIFWDDLHPSAHTHAIFSQKLIEEFDDKYRFHAHEIPRVDSNDTPAFLYKKFMGEYLKINREEKKLCFFKPDNLIRQSRIAIDDNENAYENSLKEIFDLAMSGKSKRARKILRELGWINREGKINANMESLNFIRQTITWHCG